MKKLLVYLKDYKKESVLGPLFKLLEATFELIVPLVMAAIIDTGVATGDKSYIMKMCMVLVLLAVIGLTCSVTAQYFAAKAAVGFATKLRHALFAHIERLSFTEMDTVGTATLITRMTSDVNQVQNGVNLVLRLFLRSPFIVFGAMVMAFTIDVKAALVFVVTIPLLSIIVFGIMLISIPLYKKVQSALDKVLGITRENLTGSRVIRAFNKEDDEKVHFNENNDLLTRAQIYVGKISALMNPLTYVIINGAIVVLVWTGAVRVDNGYITQGEVVALINYMSQILVELVKLANLIININKSIACGNRIQSIFEMQPSITDGSGQKVDKVQTDTADRSEEAEYAVEFSHVGLTYAGAGDESLTDIDFKVKKGETIGIIGGTGSGKSSVVNLIPRFYDVTSGFIKVDGKDVKDYPLEELRGKIGTVLQKAVLFHGTIRENLKWGNPDATEEDLNRAITVAQAKEFVDNKEGRLDFEIEQGGKNLSGGQRQRLTIARAVVKKPEILILDDSASALDFATDAALRKAIREMEGETTVFIVSQRAASIQHADRIVVLDDGKIVGLGTSEELLESCEVYQEIYNSQFKKQEGGKTA
ncbi:ABC transporter ATP-binding protein [Roseburia intestinalis]|jgi:ABC-type multidrug transport system fused ATPase/permease subunit|uniref:ABC transporter ATP-binding protein n=1 Tax=Roseburia intestinalis TaxID=166486 RepID=UPI0001CD83DA|nr:ABC transporter ATP-binding protein [Roseburia intestinalis]CBL10608.1 ABC-type multidrug transport system, ATPase and permease components [Roseburia intestinalis M50/1]